MLTWPFGCENITFLLWRYYECAHLWIFRITKWWESCFTVHGCDDGADFTHRGRSSRLNPQAGERRAEPVWRWGHMGWAGLDHNTVSVCASLLWMSHLDKVLHSIRRTFHSCGLEPLNNSMETWVNRNILGEKNLTDGKRMEKPSSGGILLAQTGSTCPLKEKSHCKLIQS